MINQSRFTLAMALFGLVACGRNRDGLNHEDHARKDDRKGGSVAFHVGEAAHVVATQSGKVAAAAGKELQKGAKEAQRGWVNSADKAKQKKIEEQRR